MTSSLACVSRGSHIFLNNNVAETFIMTCVAYYYLEEHAKRTRGLKGGRERTLNHFLEYEDGSKPSNAFQTMIENKHDAMYLFYWLN